jgi:nucleoside-diphosphate-sugar epimerase
MIHHHHSVSRAPKRVVVLGSSGFVGQHLIRHLKESDMATAAYSSKEIDLVNPSAVARLQQTIREDDAVVMVSAITPDKGKDIKTLMRNLTLAEHVAACLENTRCAQVVYISSDAVYDDAANPVRENSACNPAAFHGLMHLAREKMLANTLQKTKVPFLILRPTLLYGPNDTHNGYGPNRFLRTARQDRKITLFGNGEEKRDHVFIEDLSRLIVLGLVHQSEGVLNIATGVSHSFHDVAQQVAAHCPGRVQMECLPRTTPITHRHFDIGELIKAFPAFQFTSLEQGLCKTNGAFPVKVAA